MRLRLPSDQAEALRSALRKSGTREIGGQIFGEQLAPSHFVATELTFQKRRGTFARFIVDLVQATRDAMRFFDKTGHRYRQFNYIGEWHSHPSFAVQPSGVDRSTMRALVSNSGFRGNFALLLITRLDDDRLRAAAWVFDAASGEAIVDLEIEG